MRTEREILRDIVKLRATEGRENVIDLYREADEVLSIDPPDTNAVEDAVDWAYRNGYYRGEVAASQLAKIIGKELVKVDLGAYGDKFEWRKTKAPNVGKAEGEAFKACRTAIDGAVDSAHHKADEGN
jgi:hypothetical protein